jgi:adenylate kinase family enzyme
MPVVDYYRERNKVVEVDATFDRDTVYSNVQKAIEPSLSTAA